LYILTTTQQNGLYLLQVEEINFGARFIADGSARQAYIQQTQQMSKFIREEVMLGRLSYADGAKEAHNLRNTILDAARLKSTDITWKNLYRTIRCHHGL